MSWLDILKWLFGPISEKRKDETKSTNGENSTGHQPKLTREDVLRLIKENGGPEGLDLSGYDLSGVDLTKLDLHGVIFGNLEILLFATDKALTRRANLEGTWFERSNLQRANFGRANLRGAHFYHTDLTEATFWAANAEGADFRKANLSKADLYSTVLKDCRLMGAHLNKTNLYLANLQGATLSVESVGSKILQESLDDYGQYYARWYVTPLVREKYEQRHMGVRYEEAIEVYLGLKNAFLNAGRYDDASWAHFKERQMGRKTYSLAGVRRYYGHELPENCSALSWQWWKFHLKYISKWVLEWITELLIGYGERPLRVVFWAIVAILAFPVLYWLSSGITNPMGHPVRWIDYLHYSLATFSTIGFPDLIPANDIAKLFTSLEALSGISALALLMFALGNRVSRS